MRYPEFRKKSIAESDDVMQTGNSESQPTHLLRPTLANHDRYALKAPNGAWYQCDANFVRNLEYFGYPYFVVDFSMCSAPTDVAVLTVAS